MDLITMDRLCRRLVSSQENQEPILEPNLPQRIQIFGNCLPTVVRCKTDKVQPPIKVKIEYSMQDDLHQVDLLICYSFSHKNPSFDNCDKKFENKPHYLVVYSKDQQGKKLGTFIDQYLYISFQSEIGCSLELT